MEKKENAESRKKPKKNHQKIGKKITKKSPKIARNEQTEKKQGVSTLV